MSRSGKTSVLLICAGNICRSPLAEGVFLHKANLRGVAERFAVDSAGTGDWHAGEPPDPRTSAIAAEHGIILSGRARQLTPNDLRRFDHLICMDEANRRALARMGAPQAKVRLLLEVDHWAAVREVPDPYYSGPEGFQIIYKLIDSACDALLDELLAVAP